MTYIKKYTHQELPGDTASAYFNMGQKPGRAAHLLAVLFEALLEQPGLLLAAQLVVAAHRGPLCLGREDFAGQLVLYVVVLACRAPKCYSSGGIGHHYLIM